MYSSRRAARRFYEAFYCWNRLNGSPSCKRFASVNLQPSAADAQSKKGTAGPSITKHRVGDRDQPGESRNARVRKDEFITEEMRIHMDKLPLLSLGEKPFDTFKAWERVARYRSDTGGLLQIAIPQYAARILQQSKWERLQSPGHARIELGPIVTIHDESLQSVAVSGTFAELHRTVSILSEPKLPDYMFSDPVSLVKRPSASIGPYEKVVRRRSTDYCEIETSIPVRNWHLVQRKQSRGAIERQCGTKIVTGKVVSLAHSSSPDATANMQPLLVSGLPDDVRTTFTYINEYRRSPVDSSIESKMKARSSDVQSPAKDVAQPDSSIKRLIVWVPEGPKGEVVARERVVKRHNYKINGCRVNVWDEGAFFSIAGTSMSKIRNVKSYMRSQVNDACDSYGVPRVELEERETEIDLPDGASSPVSPSAKANTAIDGAKQNAAVNNTSKNARGGSLRDNPQETPSEDMRRALRALSHPVVLVTSRVPRGPSNRASRDAINDRVLFYRGLTVSSFNSVTLDPEVIVSFNVRVPSRTWDAISDSRNLVAHFLTASPAGAALAHEFTRPHERPDEAFWNLRRMGAYVSGARSRTAAPKIRFKDAVLATVRATLVKDKCVAVGDHMIVVAKVDKVELPDEVAKKALSDANVMDKGLTYAQRGYRSVGHEIQPMTMSEAQSQSQQTSAVGLENRGDVSTQSKQAATPELDDETIGGMVGADVDSDIKQSKPTLSPEQTDIDYFQAIEEDELEADEGNTSESDALHQDALQEEEEYDFGFGAVEDEGPVGVGLQSEPLVEDSAAAREDKEGDDNDAARSRSDERPDEKDEREEAQKRSALKASGS